MKHQDLSRQIIGTLRHKDSVLVLGIESSCDETAASVVKNGRTILSSSIYSQIDLHTVYGGVVPEIASRAHVEKIDVVVDLALDDAGITLEDIDVVAVTCGPGLVGALLVGVSYAKALAFAAHKPLIGVNHIEGHICANYLTHPHLEPPFLCLVVSGGHSHILSVTRDDEYRVIGCTRDDAAGECFDKAARVLGLPYPGGPSLDKIAQEGNFEALVLPHPHTQGRYDFSFSGLKTAFINALHTMDQQQKPYEVKDMAASFRKAVVSSLVEKTMMAAEDLKAPCLLMAGGVSANRLLRKTMQEECDTRGITLYMPDLALCGDNAAMIAAAGYRKAMRGQFDDLNLNAQPALRLI
ncbi:MAG: tRNA (adenosine(37)-N6)-threonylcarbamoyltransferase complex transferase subunit TsaD [Eubacteriales bacterium]|nr:tRNA (adenosine(37)-N6)-threonylcarbamoyltransferase complex transferase subunit TsaD [Eubacteriales bacterium]MDD4105463.1 tRNA (adenosine(37)-N6)-threonylcarbamoyltransferase complex transferase subunit TsaD [Eubacteriales bacterium]MDD4710701.1 tRNA (adenosine(37)-N6)-threonylcarbamoyltransferase complex transferase subunit TsaD [Eubacteriales bacterium]NLO16411.1 tRNA (adenosine(37)-N6)-threonylcarbamoyltransferase complex transferase subunit TsaD [Clostridiales bacterium]